MRAARLAVLSRSLARSQDYHWWWRAFLTSGCSAFYMLIYGVIYYYTRSDFADAVSTVLYFGWTLVMALLMFVVTGTGSTRAWRMGAARAGRLGSLALSFALRALSLSLFVCVGTGTVGFLACLWFVRKIYSVIKID